MKTHTLIQSTPEWHAYRASHFNASDAPAMLGCSPYKTRSQLLHERHTGLLPEVDAAAQRRFDDGHRFEALARPLAEKIIGQELWPVTGSSGNLSASFDGLVMDESIAWEHKSLNKDLRAVLTVAPEMVDHEAANAIIPLHYRVQMQQQCMVSGAAYVLFMASTWDGDTLVEARHCWYESDAQLAADINAGWAQFAVDLAAYVPPPAAELIVAEPVQALPAVLVQVSGDISVKDNFKAFEIALKDFLEHRLIRSPKTDQDFADLDLQIKAMKGAEAALDAAEVQMLAQVQAVDQAKKTKDMLAKLVRDNRLMAEKLLASEKERRKAEIVSYGFDTLREHIANLNVRIGKNLMPTIVADFASAVKGLRSLDSMEDAVSTRLANAKIEASSIADRIQANLATLTELGSAHKFLFSDADTIVLKANDDLTALVKNRIAEHQAQEVARIASERARIAAEERTKAQAIERARADAEIAAATAQARAEATTQAQAQAQAQADAQAKRASDQAIAKAAQPLVTTLFTPLSTPLSTPAASDSPLGPPTLRIGQISERLGFNLNSEFIKTLGFEPAARANNAVLYHEADFAPICCALVRHIHFVTQGVAA